MAGIVVHPRPRSFMEPAPAEAVEIRSPPAKPGSPGVASRLLQLGTPLVGAATGVAYVFIQPAGALAFVMLGSAAVGILTGVLTAVQQSTSGRGRARTDRQRYRALLDRVEAQLVDLAGQQSSYDRSQFPDVSSLKEMIEDPYRLWERRRSDRDFGVLRVGSGPAPFTARPKVQATELLDREMDAELLEEARLLEQRFANLDDSATGIQLHDGELVTIVGGQSATRALARSLIVQMATLQSPADLRIAVCSETPDGGVAWEWAKWLPHAREGATDDQGRSYTSLIAVSTQPQDTEAMLEHMLDGRTPAPMATGAAAVRGGAHKPDDDAPLLVIVVEGWSPHDAATRSPRLRDVVQQGSFSSTAVICLVDNPTAEPARATRRIRLDEKGSGVVEVLLEAGRPGPPFLPESLGEAEAAELARKLARYQPPVPYRSRRGRTGVLRLSSLVGLDPEHFDPVATWAAGANDDDYLRVPIGDHEGDPVILDIRDTAYGGMGPNGILIGAPGAGKSELLRTLITGLALKHTPDRLALVLVDFKGGTAFTPFRDLPHNAGIVTNLEGDPSMVVRFRDAVLGELERRQHLFRDSGGDITRYNQAAARSGQPRVPHLLLVVDEFAELMSAFPDFEAFFETVSRLGRGLGVFALLSTQGLQGGLSKLERYISYRLCLRTNNAQESQAVIGSAAAARLPRVPGVGLLQVGPGGKLIPFKAALVTAPLAAGGSTASVRPFGLVASTETEAAQNDSGVRTELDAIAARLAGADIAHVEPVWRQPLPSAMALDSVLSQASLRPLEACVGRLDLPRQQRQVPFILDLARNAANTVICGRSQSGRSTTLQTILLSLAVTHGPEELQFYCADYGGGRLSLLSGLPHVGMMAGSRDLARIRRSLHLINGLIDDRSGRFTAEGIGGADDFRKRRAAGTFDDGFGDVILVIDGWAAASEDLDLLHETGLRILMRGPALGVHLIATIDRINDLRSGLRDRFTGRVQLQPTDPSDGLFDSRVMRTLPPGLAGRALGGEPPGHVQIALPRLDGHDSVDDLDQAIAQAVHNEAVPGRAAPTVELLPDSLALTDLAPEVLEAKGLPIGLAESDLAPVYVDPMSRPDMHLVIYGDAQTGKSSFLDGWLRLLCRRYRPDEARVALFDLRRAHMGAADEDHLVGQAFVPSAVGALLKELEDMLAERFPPGDATVQELELRSYIDGPELFVVIDDEDAVDAGAFKSFSRIIDYSWECKLHFVVVRRTGMAPHDALSSRLREAGALTLVLSERTRSTALPRPVPLPLGRAHLIGRDETPQLVQLIRAGA